MYVHSRIWCMYVWICLIFLFTTPCVGWAFVYHHTRASHFWLLLLLLTGWYSQVFGKYVDAQNFLWRFTLQFVSFNDSSPISFPNEMQMFSCLLFLLHISSTVLFYAVLCARCCCTFTFARLMRWPTDGAGVQATGGDGTVESERIRCIFGSPLFLLLIICCLFIFHFRFRMPRRVYSIFLVSIQFDSLDLKKGHGTNGKW